MSQPQAFPGPIKVSQDGRYFTDSRGMPFFWLGDIAWPLFAQYTPENAKRTIDSTCALIYLSSPCHVRLNLDKMLTERVRGIWVNPQKGEQKDDGDYLTRNRTGSVFPQGQRPGFQHPIFGKMRF